MLYSEQEMKVLREYGLVDEHGQPVQVKLLRPEGNPLGVGPKLEPKAMQKLIAADTTPDERWLEWIFYQAAGGDKGKEGTKRAMEQLKKRFVDERVNGFHHPETKKYYGPVPRAEAEARWEKAKHGYDEILTVADQDSVDRLGVFGFFRAWPGQDRIYEKVEQAVRAYLKLYPKLLQMNKEMLRDGRQELPTEPTQLPTIDAMVQTTRKVDRYFASKVAREDIRTDVIFDDDYITALAPLTYAAAVKYGHDEWSWANRAKFDEVLGGDTAAYNDQWKSNTSSGKVYVYLSFKYPVPSWISRKNGTFERRRLTNLALELDKNTLRAGNINNVVVWDEENRNTMRIGDVKQQIMNEPTRPPDPQDDEIPIKRGPNVYKTKEEAAEVVRHLDLAVVAVLQWARSFDPKRIKSDAMTLANAEAGDE